MKITWDAPPIGRPSTGGVESAKVEPPAMGDRRGQSIVTAAIFGALCRDAAVDGLSQGYTQHGSCESTRRSSVPSHPVARTVRTPTVGTCMNEGGTIHVCVRVRLPSVVAVPELQEVRTTANNLSRASCSREDVHEGWSRII